MVDNSRLLEAEMIRRELARRELLPFVEMTSGETYKAGWVHQDLCALLDAFTDGVEKQKSPRLMVWIPPRHGKSQIISRCYPAYVLGQHPEWEVVNASYGQDLASDMGRAVRSTLLDPLFLELFPRLGVDPSTQAADRIDTFLRSERGGAMGRQRGGYKAVGVGTALTGRGAHILIIDDPVKDRAEADSEAVRVATLGWYTSVARTRLAPGGGIIILQTRWHEEDLSGCLIAKAKANKLADQWGVYRFPAIAERDEYDFTTGRILRRRAGEALHPERFPTKELDALKASIGTRDWEALYQQNPTPSEGTYFRRDWFKFWRE